MPKIDQGDIWWADLPDPTGRRPVLVLTRTDAIPSLANVTVAPLTRTIRGIPSEVRITTQDGVPTECAISLDNILTIRIKTLDKPIAQLSRQRMEEVFQAVRFAFAMPK